ncbi:MULTISPECIES: hypothetical protein [Moraxella]|uniref:hypothetical protein n=1 Tax=Moraxella TaxID=475 RepID=UPI0007E2F8BE|nr:hypothetical protein [Moraxella catarrhalis]STY82416.1 Uncharacterised protein [Moraxella catarrhalis]
MNEYYSEFTLMLVSMMVGFFMIQPLSLLIVLMFLYRYWMNKNLLELRITIYILLAIHGYSCILFILNLVFFSDFVLSVFNNINGITELFIVYALSLVWILSSLFVLVGWGALRTRKYFFAFYWHLSMLLISLVVGVVWFVSRV